MPLRLRRCAPAVFLALLLTTACGGDPEPNGADDNVASSPEPTPSEPTPSELAESTAPSAPSAPASGVPQETTDEFFEALNAVVKRFTRFERQYQAAVDAKDSRGLLAAASRVRDGFFKFDSQVRALDLTAVQPELDILLDVNGRIIKGLDDTANATSGQEARAALRALDFGEFTDAFSGLAAAL